MQQTPPPLPEDSEEIAKKISSGEFFRESMEAYHKRYVDLISERYFYLGITAASVLIFLCSIVSIMLLYPLNKRVPFIYQTVDAVDDLPIMKPMGERKVDVNQQIKEFLVANYIRFRENYSIDTLDRNANGVKSQSTDALYQQYQTLMDPANPNSPISLYQRQGVRNVAVERVNISNQGKEYRAEAKVNATLVTPEGTKKETLRVIITFSFDDIAVNQDTGDVSPLRFLVTSYQSEIVGS